VVFERFTERARGVVVAAQEAARGFSHEAVGTEHLLLGLVRDPDGLGARALQSFGVTVERVSAELLRVRGSSDRVTAGQLPFTALAKRVLEAALSEALSLGHNYIGTEHIVLAICRDSDGLAAQILITLDANPDRVREEMIRMLSGLPTPDTSARRAPGSQPGHVDPGVIGIDCAWVGGFGLGSFLRDLTAEISIGLGAGSQIQRICC
jgi:ATP-dependent Clp protease ATP-binding subunit ClpC